MTEAAKSALEAAVQRVAKLPCWKGPVEPRPLEGGITNLNFVVADGDTKYFVRSGSDIPVHGIMRFNELAAAQAAAASGISPAVTYHEPGILVTDFIEGRTLEPADVRHWTNRREIVSLIRKCHYEIPKHFRGPALVFWPFQTIRGYATTLRDGASRCVDMLPDLLEKAEEMEKTVGPVELVFGHNDLLAANFIDDGKRLWLFDWDYAGFNSALFDLANVASNNEFEGQQEEDFLGEYYGAIPDAKLWRRFRAISCASLLRETMWSMVSEIHSQLDFDYVAYTTDYLGRFERAYEGFAAMESAAAEAALPETGA